MLEGSNFYNKATPKRPDIGRIFECGAFQIFFSKHFGVPSKLMKYLNIEIPGEANIANTNAALRVNERDRVTTALIQYLSEQQCNKNPKAWVTAVTAREEYLAGKLTIPLLATIFIKDSKLNDEVSDNFLFYQENSTLKAITINGEIFDPTIIADYRNVILSAQEKGLEW
ncbi:MAG: hypothetical protein KAJ14_16570 [Candidatus Omnitrophica bacterium]|nr:hypothetical protein [Candidatus Omnitrophota bacterium]